MGNHLLVDRKACAGHGLCYGVAPDVLDADDQGDPVVTADPVPDDRFDDADAAVGACPERALSWQRGVGS